MTRSKRARRLARREYNEKRGAAPAPKAPQNIHTQAHVAVKRTAKSQPAKPFYARQQFTYALYTVVTILAVGFLIYWVFGREKPATGGVSTTPVSASDQTSAVRKQYASPPPMTIDPSKSYFATIETDRGTIKAELFAKDAPKTVNNFVFLSREGFYDGLTFHRVLADFMAQTGDPSGDGTGGPGYKFEDEFSERKHLIGTLSMANSGPNTNGSQFFITYAPQSHLDGVHSVFGQVTEGMDVLQKITLRDPSARPAFSGDRIKKITIEEK